MSDGNRRDRYAIIALVFALAAIVLVVWFSQPPNEQATQTYSQSADYPKEHHGPAEGRWWPEISARDTYAQWFMAIMALVATGVSIWAIRILRDTLDQTRLAVKSADDAVVVTREIGQAQVRAYLSPSIEKFFRQDGQANPLQIRMTIKNTGQSPALRVSHATAFLVIDVQLHESHDFIDQFKFDDNFFALGAGDVSRGDMHWITEDELSGIMAGHLFCYIAALARYQDVFSNDTWHITRHAYMLRPDPMSVQGPGLEPFGWGGITNNQQT